MIHKNYLQSYCMFFQQNYVFVYPFGVWKIIQYPPTSMKTIQKPATLLQNQRFRKKLQQSWPNYAYQLLIYQIIVQDQHHARKPTVEEISRLIQLYMVAVEVLQSAADKRYDYFKRKIHSLMLKKHIVQQMHMAAGRPVDKKTMQQCEKADLQTRKNQHQAQVYFSKTDNTKIQQILKRAQQQVKTLNTNIRKNIMTQQATLQQRIRTRKMKSESGSSLGKFKIESHNAVARDKEGKAKIDPRMQYFDDYGEEKDKQKRPVIGSSTNLRAVFGSAEKDIRKPKFL